MASKPLKLTAKAARARFAELVAEAKAGRASIITYHGRVLAVVVPAQGRSVAAVAAALTGSLEGGRS
jgi:prevent-host-death family protein